MLDFRGSVIAICYIVAAVLFIFGLKRLSSPATARSGNRIAAIGMALALGVTLLDRQIVSYWTIATDFERRQVIGVYSPEQSADGPDGPMGALFNGRGGRRGLVRSPELAADAHGNRSDGGIDVIVGTAIASLFGRIVAFGQVQEISRDH